MVAEHKIGAAKFLLADKAPQMAGYFTFPMIESSRIETMAMTTKARIIFNRTWVDSLTVPQIAGVIVHEWLHHLLDHCTRLVHAIDDIANSAMDMVINPMVRDWGFELPPSDCWPKRYGFPEGLTAEDYYNRLLALEEGQQPKPGFGEKGEGCGGAAGNPHPSGIEDEIDDDSDDPNAPQAPSPRPQTSPDGDANEGDDAAPQEAPQGSATAAAADIANEGPAGEMMRAAVSAAAGRNPGKMPKALLKEIDALAPVAVADWRRRLDMTIRNAVQHVGAGGAATFTRPHRFQAGIGYGPGKPILPVHTRTVPKVVGAIDSSGSMMGSSELAQACGQIDSIMTALGTPITLVVIDAKVHSITKIKRASEARKLIKGGGGTDFTGLFDAYKKGKLPCNVMIMTTDGFAFGIPAKNPPGMRMIWVLIGEGAALPAHVTWGDIVRVEPPKAKR